jgi:phage-related protein
MSTGGGRRERKPLAWLHGEVETPPFSAAARREAGELLGRLQEGENLGMPHSRPMPSIGPRCHELRIRDEDRNWRIIYRIEPTSIQIAEVFAKTTRQTPDSVIDACRSRFAEVDRIVREARKATRGKSKGSDR